MKKYLVFTVVILTSILIITNNAGGETSPKTIKHNNIITSENLKIVGVAILKEAEAVNVYIFSTINIPEYTIAENRYTLQIIIDIPNAGYANRDKRTWDADVGGLVFVRAGNYVEYVGEKGNQKHHINEGTRVLIQLSNEPVYSFEKIRGGLKITFYERIPKELQIQTEK